MNKFGRTLKINTLVLTSGLLLGGEESHKWQIDFKIAYERGSIESQIGQLDFFKTWRWTLVLTMGVSDREKGFLDLPH